MRCDAVPRAVKHLVCNSNRQNLGSHDRLGCAPHSRTIGSKPFLLLLPEEIYEDRGDDDASFDLFFFSFFCTICLFISFASVDGRRQPLHCYDKMNTNETNSLSLINSLRLSSATECPTTTRWRSEFRINFQWFLSVVLFFRTEPAASICPSSWIVHRKMNI